MGSIKKLFCRNYFGKLFKLGMGSLSSYMKHYNPMRLTISTKNKMLYFQSIVGNVRLKGVSLFMLLVRCICIF